MYWYKFETDISELPCDTRIQDVKPEGYVGFGNGESVDWTVNKRQGGVLVAITNFSPPVSTYIPTAEEKKKWAIDSLNWEYTPQFDALAIAYSKALMDSNTLLASDIASDNSSLRSEYNEKMKVIINGN